MNQPLPLGSPFPDGAGAPSSPMDGLAQDVEHVRSSAKARIHPVIRTPATWTRVDLPLSVAK